MKANTVVVTLAVISFALHAAFFLHILRHGDAVGPTVLHDVPSVQEDHSPARAVEDSCADAPLSRILCQVRGSDYVPHVAVCFHGAARTLTHYPVFRSLRQNLIEAFGGHTTVFAFIKTSDARGDERNAFGGTIPAEEASVRRALQFLGAAPRNVQILEGSETASWTATCPDYPELVEVPGKSHVSSVGYERSLAAQLRGRRECADMIIREERRSGQRFDYIFLTRPDASLPWPVPPYCTQNVDSFFEQHDWMQRFPRRALEDLAIYPHEEYTGCRAPRALTQSIENYVAEMWKSKGIVMDHKAPCHVMSPMVIRIPGDTFPRLHAWEKYEGSIVDTHCNRPSTNWDFFDAKTPP